MATSSIERHPRRVRSAHAAVYLLTLGLLLTGWWLFLGGEGHPSPLSRLFGVADTRLHVWLGRALAVALVIAPVVVRGRIRRFVRETLRRDRGDGRWFLRWPAAAFTGRFGRHQGRYDPGQRVANALMLLGLVALVASGLGLTLLHGGPTFALLARIHLWTTIALTPLVAGHVLVASGVLPGYRGVWRTMHLGGRVSRSTVERLWPATLEERDARAPIASPGTGSPAGSKRDPSASIADPAA